MRMIASPPPVVLRLAAIARLARVAGLVELHDAGVEQRLLHAVADVGQVDVGGDEGVAADVGLAGGRVGGGDRRARRRARRSARPRAAPAGTCVSAPAPADINRRASSDLKQARTRRAVQQRRGARPSYLIHILRSLKPLAHGAAIRGPERKDHLIDAPKPGQTFNRLVRQTYSGNIKSWRYRNYDAPTGESRRCNPC